MSALVLIGRILFGLIFMGSAVGHFTQTDATAAYGEARGIPSPRLLVQLSGVVILLGGLGVILGVWIDLAALAVAGFTLSAAIMVHHFWTDEEPTRAMEMIQFMKNLSLTGAGLMLFAFAAAAGSDLGLTLTDPLFSGSL